MLRATYIQGYTRNKVSQLQFTATKVIGPENPFHADQLVLIGEVGADKVWNLPLQSVLRYNSDGTDTGGGPDVNSGNLNNPETQTEGFRDGVFVGLSGRCQGAITTMRSARHSHCLRASRSIRM